MRKYLYICKIKGKSVIKISSLTIIGNNRQAFLRSYSYTVGFFSYGHALRVDPPFVLSFLNAGGEKRAFPESRQAFEVAESRPSGLVNLTFSGQSGFSGASFCLLINR